VVVAIPREAVRTSRPFPERWHKAVKKLALTRRPVLQTRNIRHILKIKGSIRASHVGGRRILSQARLLLSLSHTDININLRSPKAGRVDTKSHLHLLALQNLVILIRTQTATLHHLLLKRNKSVIEEKVANAKLIRKKYILLRIK